MGGGKDRGGGKGAVLGLHGGSGVPLSREVAFKLLKSALVCFFLCFELSLRGKPASECRAVP